MSLIVVWVSFIVLMTFCKDLDQSHYLLFSSSMLYLTYVINKVQSFELTVRGLLLFLSIPHLIFGYIAFVYNNFLALNPIRDELFLTLLFIYTYLLAYAFLENKISK